MFYKLQEEEVQDREAALNQMFAVSERWMVSLSWFFLFLFYVYLFICSLSYFFVAVVYCYYNVLNISILLLFKDIIIVRRCYFYLFKRRFYIFHYLTNLSL